VAVTANVPRPAGSNFDDNRLLALGIEGSICDGGPSDANSHIEAGQPSFGQYVAHDLTADRSPLRAKADVNTLRNIRYSRESRALYGGGPVGSPYLYIKPIQPSCFSQRRLDLPRNQQGIALIGDPRMIARLHDRAPGRFHPRTQPLSTGSGRMEFRSLSYSTIRAEPSVGTTSGSSSMISYRTSSVKR